MKIVNTFLKIFIQIQGLAESMKHLLALKNRLAAGIAEREENIMKKYTTVIWNKDITKRIMRHESVVEAFVIANDEKMKGNKAVVVEDETCRVIYG